MTVYHGRRRGTRGSGAGCLLLFLIPLVCTLIVAAQLVALAGGEVE